MPSYLTKSRFKLAQECPTKLFYTRKRDVYPDKSKEDAFLQVLADGGLQVGELAKLYHSGGVEIHEMDHAKALADTKALLQRDEAVLYEPAICFERLFIRVDVLVKRGNLVELIEVKAKSCDGRGAGEFLTKKGQPNSDWRTYLEDVAFQKYVLEHAWPEFDVTAFLMLADKSSSCPEDGLHQKFLLHTDDRGRRCVTVTAQLTDAELAQQILCKVDVDEVAEGILQEGHYGSEAGLPFASWVRELSDKYEQDARIPSEIGSKCGECEFLASAEEQAKGLRSGREECWRARLGWTDEQFEKPTVLELANFRKKDAFIAEGKVSLLDIEMEDLDFGGLRSDRISPAERRWLQVQAAQAEEPVGELRRDELRTEMRSWNFPLHFIDFETSAPAIPLHAGRHPYEALVFQFSHHVVHEDGLVEHRGQYLHEERGAWPNFEFVRALKHELDQDDGSIFRYAAHENSMLAAIHGQLHDSEEPDRQELIDFIESISQPSRSSRKWPRPKRNMIDLCALVKDYYFDPAMGGSISIKDVLPAVLNSSDWLKQRYAAPIYGQPMHDTTDSTLDYIPSLNFQAQTWVESDAQGKVRDPYELLPPIFADRKDDSEQHMSTDDALRDGSAAMAAYTRMQFAEMPLAEREALQQGLLRYCELDTLAMVMIYEAWREWCAN